MIQTGLLPGSVLKRANYIQITITGPDQVQLRAGDQELICPGEVLAILDVFAKSHSLSEGLEILKKQTPGVLAWIELTHLILELYRAGVLLDETGRRPVLDSKSSFGAPYIHIKMLNDKARTDAYLKAIQEVIRPGDVVLDLGTGTGVFAAAAARQGARHVYAIESSTIGSSAQGLIAANGLADRVTLVPGHSTQVSLPEPVDVLVSEIIGNDPLGERIRDITWDAQRRFLKPGARIIPNKLRVIAQAVTIPDEITRKYLFTASKTAEWKRWYGIDFSSLPLDNPNNFSFSIQPHLVRDWQRIGQRIILAEIDMKILNWNPIETVSCGISEAGCMLNAVVEYFEADLSAKAVLSSCPWLVDDSCNWSARVWLMQKPIKLEAGEHFELYYRHSVTGKPDVIEFHQLQR